MRRGITIFASLGALLAVGYFTASKWAVRAAGWPTSLQLLLRAAVAEDAEPTLYSSRAASYPSRNPKCPSRS
jgi:hypothetical protein